MKKFYNLTILVVGFLFLFTKSNAQKLQFENTLHQDFTFIENKGQLADENGKLLSDIKYYGKDKVVSVYCREQYISFVFSKVTYKENEKQEHLPSKFDTPKIDTMEFERMEMHFPGSNPNSQIIAELPRQDYLNFYLAHTPEKGITNVKQFEKLTYKNIYNSIDLVLIVNDGGAFRSDGVRRSKAEVEAKEGMKYEFVVHPGGKVSDIKIKWAGTTPELSDAGIIKYTNDLGTISESTPITFLSTGINLSSHFKIKTDHCVSFETESYPEGKTLIIDPTMKWSTYYGGTAYDYAYKVVAGDSGNVYFAGSTESTSGIATSGSHLSSISVGKYAFLAKFNRNGVRIWATYYGGSDTEGRGISLDTSGNIYMAGSTYSPSGIATSGSYQSTYAGNQDGFLVKFNSNGSRIWGTCYGTSDGENCYALFTDIQGNSYIGGRTSSTTGIATSGSYQTSNAGGDDAFIAKFNDTGAIQWATYYGGSNLESIYGITGNNNGSIYIDGETLSTSGISTSGSYQASNAGSYDAFLAKFNSNTGNRIWGTYYGGSGYESAYGICCYDTGSVCITGFTRSSSGISTSGAYQSYLAGSSDAYIAKFSGAGNIQWGSYFGGSNNEASGSISTSKQGNIYITGKTNSNSGIATSGTYQTTYAGGGGDAFISRFNGSGSLIWSTYFGGSGNDESQGIYAGDSSNIYVTGITLSSSGIATSGAHQTVLSGGWDAFLFKLKDCNSTDSTIIKSVCDSFVLNNITYKTSGTFKQYFTNSVNCDSTLILNLTIKHSFYTLTQAACDSFVFNSITYKTNGTYTQNLTNVAGCDSTITLNLTIQKSSSSSFSQTGCDSLVINSGTFKTSGTFIQKVQNVAGCDSNITLNLTIKKSSTNIINQTACDSFVLNNITYKFSGTYTQKKTNAAGCDSSIVLNLTIRKSSSYIFLQTACDSFKLNAITYYNSGVYTQKLTNAAGCDSTMVMTLNIKKSSSSTISQTACDSFILNGITYKTSGTYVQHKFNIVGCDSTITLSLMVKNSSSSSLSQTGCDSLVINSITYKTSGTYTQKKTNAVGCDSNILLNLTIKKSTSSNINQTACDSFVLNNITYKITGTYTQHKMNSAGCDSSIKLNLFINNGLDAHFSATINNKSVTFIPVELNAKSYLWRFGNGDTSIQKIPVYNYLSSGNYLVKLKLISLQDCESMHDTTILIQGNGIKAKNNLNEIRLYPNPAKNEVTIYGLTVESTLTLMDALGKVISVTDSNKTNTINTSHLANGIYFINVANEIGNVNLKLAIDN